ncbi:hypothetical protein [Methanomethylovorans sp.]|uniref:hypothetical protein n=1 Tax=Methanomethylovorans sp. TaxID=2758717 RepID=UPI00351C2E87
MKESNRKSARSDIYTGIFLLLAIGSIALIYERWVGHALIAITSLMLMVYTLATGAILKGRIKRTSGNIFNVHRRGGIYFGAFILGSFIYGLWIRLQHGDPIIASVHGKLGLIILFIVVLQVIPSLVLKNRAKYRRLHKIMGYFLAPVLIIAASWGLHNGVVSGTKNLVLLHSISGGLALLALIWIILELLYPTDKSLARARIASYLTAFLLTAGCWIAGGYNYLKDYGSQVKPVILAGPDPWVHEIVMEMKEHIFVFLPIIAFALSLTISRFDRDAFLADVKSRRALLVITTLALFIVLLMFIMGAVISNTGNTGTEA